jgi:hypothetical protein
MTDRSLVPWKIMPATLILRTGGGCELDPQHLLEAFGAQRHRFAAVLRGFGPGDPCTPCEDPRSPRGRSLAAEKAHRGRGEGRGRCG